MKLNKEKKAKKLKHHKRIRDECKKCVYTGLFFLQILMSRWMFLF